MRGTKAKRLRAQARRLAATVKRSYELSRGGGVSRWLTGYRRIYQDLKAEVRKGIRA